MKVTKGRPLAASTSLPTHDDGPATHDRDDGARQLLPLHLLSKDGVHAPPECPVERHGGLGALRSAPGRGGTRWVGAGSAYGCSGTKTSKANSGAGMRTGQSSGES